MTDSHRISSLMAISLAFILFAATIISSILNATVGILVDFPRDVEVKVGETVRLNCATDDRYNVLWQHRRIGAVWNDDIFLDGRVVYPYFGRFYVEKKNITGENRQYHLVIDSVEFTDAGRYICWDKAGHGEQIGAQLVVLGSPKCSSNVRPDGIIVGENDCGIEPDDLFISCCLPFAGNKLPSSEWETSEDILNSEANKTIDILNGEATFNLQMKADLTLNDNSIIWKTSSNYNWTFGKFTVQYVFNHSSSYHTIDPLRMTCSANSTQPCRYTWSNNGTILPDVEETIQIELVGSYICSAECSLRGTKCTVTPLFVQFMEKEFRAITEMPKDNVSLKIYVPLAVSLLLLIVICIVSIIICTKRRIRDRLKTQPRTSSEGSVKPQEILAMLPSV